MKRNYYDKLQDEVSDIALKTEGIAFLLRFHQPEGEGLRDNDARIGISMILEDLAKQGREAAEMLDVVNRKTYGFDIG